MPSPLQLNRPFGILWAKLFDCSPATKPLTLLTTPSTVLCALGFDLASVLLVFSFEFASPLSELTWVELDALHWHVLVLGFVLVSLNVNFSTELLFPLEFSISIVVVTFASTDSWGDICVEYCWCVDILSPRNRAEITAFNAFKYSPLAHFLPLAI